MRWFCFGNGLWVMLYLVCFLGFIGGVNPKPLPQDGGTVTQTGEPSHFQVDDKAAEIEVNANPAGVKVNAKPASLQVVAKPGTPAVPIFHPAIHLAQHYAPPPVIHRQPAVFYHGCFRFPYCHNWFYNGIKRGNFPRPRKDETNLRTHKSDIPHASKHKKDVKTWKRQFISAIPQLVKPSSLGALRGLTSYGTYGYGALPQYAPVSSILGAYGLRQVPQPRLFASPAQLAPEEGLQETALSRGFVPTLAGVQDNSEVLRSYQKFYSELNGLSSLYNELLRQRGLNSQQGLGYGTALGLDGATNVNAESNGLGYVPSTQGTSRYSDAMMAYGKAYLPSPLLQFYGAHSSLAQSNGLFGPLLVGQQVLSPYTTLSPMVQREPLVGRSKVPGAAEKKIKKHPHAGFLKDKKKVEVKRQTLVEPILQEEPSSDDDLLQDGTSQDYKRQFILTPALETLQQLQPLQSAVSQESIQPQIRQLQLQQLLQQQALAQQSVGFQPVAGIQPLGMQQLGFSGSQQLGNLLPLESTPLRYLTSSFISPVERLGPTLTSRPSSRLSARMMSPMTSSVVSPSLAPSSFISPLISSGFSQPRNVIGIQSASPGPVFQDRSIYRHPLSFEYPSYTRRLFRSPQYRRRLHNFREGEDLDGIQPEVLGKEQITTQGSYTTERIPTTDGETLVNSPVGFGPITVEAKTAEGARAAQADVDDKRHHINKPVKMNHKSKLKEKSLT